MSDRKVKIYPWERCYTIAPYLDQALVGLGLKPLPEGTQVSPPDCMECLGVLTFPDGSSLRVFGTELGFWIGKTVPLGQRYQDLDTLFNDFHLRCYHDGDDLHPMVTTEKDILVFISARGDRYEIPLTCLTEDEVKIYSHPKGYDLLSEAASFGDMWRGIFYSKDWDKVPPYQGGLYPQDIPDELRFPPYEREKKENA